MIPSVRSPSLSSRRLACGVIPALGARRGVLTALLLALVASGGGCSRGGVKQHPTHPVSGRAGFGGKPPVGAHLVFHPQPEKPGWGDLPSAVVAADGSYRVSTYRDGDGAPAGEYAVTAQWFPVGQDGTVGVNALDRSFATPASTPLRVTIQPGTNDVPAFELSAKRAAAVR